MLTCLAPHPMTCLCIQSRPTPSSQEIAENSGPRLAAGINFFAKTDCLENIHNSNGKHVFVTPGTARGFQEPLYPEPLAGPQWGREFQNKVPLMASSLLKHRSPFCPEKQRKRMLFLEETNEVTHFQSQESEPHLRPETWSVAGKGGGFLKSLFLVTPNESARHSPFRGAAESSGCGI